VKGAGDPRVALVVLTHERRALVCRQVERALALPERPPIYAVDNGSRDGTARALARFGPRVRVLRSERNLGAAGRNLGAAAAEARYVAFADDDTWYAPGALARAADHLDADPGVAVVSGCVLVRGRPDPACLAMARSVLGEEGGRVAVVGFLAGACVVRRAAFLEAGGYEPRLFLGAEESLLALDLLAAGWRLAYCADVRVHHEPAPRDAGARRARLRRNEVKVAWLRRPLRRAFPISLAAWRRCESRGERARLALDLARSLPWLLRARRLVPPAVEARVRAVEASAGAAARAAAAHPGTTLAGAVDGGTR